MPRLKLYLTALACAGILLADSAPAGAEWSGPCLQSNGPAAAGEGPTCHFWKGKVTFVDDGDTIDVRMRTSTGKRKTIRVRIIGIQAMEQRVYTRDPRKRRGACHALPATARLEQLLRSTRGSVRLAAQEPSSASGGRVRRSVAIKVAGTWRDVGSVLLAEGHVLWLPHPVEYAWNSTYNRLAQQAAATRANLWNPAFCGPGPGDGTLRLTVYPDAKGNDFMNVNGEHVTIENIGPTPVPLTGWWLRDSTLRRLRLPSWVTIQPGGELTIRVGKGDDTEDTIYWGLADPVFENATKGRGMGDGAYLFDPQGDLRAWMMYPCFTHCAG